MIDDAVYARAFARALYGSAAARHETERVTQDMLALEQQWQGSPELRTFFRRHLPGTPHDRAQTIIAIWGDTLSPVTRAFLIMLAQRDHLSLVPHLFRQYEKIEEHARGCNDVRMTFACAPDDQQTAQIRALVAQTCGPVMKVSLKIDPGLIAGVCFFVNDKRIDASLAGRLARLRHGLSLPMAPAAMQNEK